MRFRRPGPGVHMAARSLLRATVGTLLSVALGLLMCPGRSAAAAPPHAAATAICVAPQRPARPSPPVAGSVFQDCRDTPPLVYIPSGTFQMGDQLGDGYSYERPVHTVHVKTFLLGQDEVTVAEWQRCAAAGACREDAAGQADGPRYPITLVSWDDAEDYVHWLRQVTGKHYRLPSEAEWEYAARAGSSDQYTWGNSEEAACRHANLFDLDGRQRHPAWRWSVDCYDGYAEVAPVGQFPPTIWGLYDMIGNVWEWLADCWHADYEGAPADGSAWVEPGCTKHVNRGGGWGNHPRSARVSARDGDLSSSRSNGLGFRVARDRVASDSPPATQSPAPPAAAANAGAH